MAYFSHMSKAKVLDDLKDKIKSAKVFDQICFSVKIWQTETNQVLAAIARKDWFNIALIIRSSSLQEDSSTSSLAGHFDSILNVQGQADVEKAIDQVAGCLTDESDEIFIQPMLQNVKLSGVVFTRDPNNNAPYFKINYSKSSQTDVVTSGTSNHLKTFSCHRLHPNQFNDYRDSIIALCFELESLLSHPSLDIEFGIDNNDQLYLFQVRPLIIPEIEKEADQVCDQDHYESVLDLSRKIKVWMQKHPYLYGDTTLYGVMPDWNPAEIIGIKPKTLALSIYREIITDSIWAYQRDNYGYCNLRSFPLITSLEGMPYIDVRVSFNSFIPKSLNSETADKLVNYYLNKLKVNPDLHDKVEFDILFSCFTFSTEERIQILEKNNFNMHEIQDIKDGLFHITDKIIHDQASFLKADFRKISQLEKKYDIVMNSEIDEISKIYWLIEDCKRYGSLPFAGLARSGFIAVELLKSLTHIDILSEQEYHDFLASLNTVSSDIIEDFNLLGKPDFLLKYGHLRPGTYDILSKTYDEDPDGYFNWDLKNKKSLKTKDFRLSIPQLNAIDKQLRKYGFKSDAIELLNFIKAAIEAREYAKFIFTRSVSQVLKIYSSLCQSLDITLEDAAFTDIQDIMSLNSKACNIKNTIIKSVETNRLFYTRTQKINLPTLITESYNPLYFYEMSSKPNYITQKKISQKIIILNDHNKNNITDKIVFIESADPGHDWIFSKNIRGLITKYGGCNSHMAIRSAELSIPAAIGIGSLYNELKKKSHLILDCQNQTMKGI